MAQASETPSTLYVIVNGQVHAVRIPAQVLNEGESFFSKMDQDMDAGWQMSREWVENPPLPDRCRIAAERLVDAMMTGKQTLANLMAGYIKVRMPEVAAVDVDTGGDVFATELIDGARFEAGSRRPSPDEARHQAEKEVSQVHRVGKSYRYQVFDRVRGQWVEAATLADEDRARVMREQAVEQRMQELSEIVIWKDSA